MHHENVLESPTVNPQLVVSLFDRKRVDSSLYPRVSAVCEKWVEATVDSPACEDHTRECGDGARNTVEEMEGVGLLEDVT